MPNQFVTTRYTHAHESSWSRCGETVGLSGDSQRLSTRSTVWFKAGTVVCLPQLATHSRSWTKSLHHVGVYRLTAQRRLLCEWHGQKERVRQRESEIERETWRRAWGADRPGVREILGQKSIHQWQICWWYESIIRRVKDRLSLIISLKIAQMTSIRHGHVDTYVPSVMVCGWGRSIRSACAGSWDVLGIAEVGTA